MHTVISPLSSQTRFQTTYPTCMSSATISSTNFQSILDVVLESYAEQTGVDLTNHPFAHKLQSCTTSADILELLQDRETAFKDYQNKNRKLINCLGPVVQVVHAFSGVLGKVAGLVSPIDRISFMRSYLDASPSRYHFSLHKRSLLELMFSSQYVSLHSSSRSL